MKKLTALCLTICLLVAMAVPVNADQQGSEIYLGESDFFDKTHNSNPAFAINADNYTLSYRFSSGGGSCVSKVYMDSESNQVVIKLRNGLSISKEKKFVGTIVLKDKDKGGFRYYAEVDIVVDPLDYSYMEPSSSGTYTLPSDYQSRLVRFVDQDDRAIGENIQKFYANFDGRAVFTTKVLEQEALFLGYSTAVNSDVESKHGQADLRFISWSLPKFGTSGDLTIKCDKNEYVYEILSDGSLRKFGSYNSSSSGYTGKTDTLGSYVISDTPLNASAAVPDTTTPEAMPSPGDYSGKNPNTGR